MDGSGRPTGGERRKENTSAGYKYISNFIFWCVVPPPTPLLAREVWLKKMTRHLKKTGGGGKNVFYLIRIREAGRGENLSN